MWMSVRQMQNKPFINLRKSQSDAFTLCHKVPAAVRSHITLQSQTLQLCLLTVKGTQPYGCSEAGHFLLSLALSLSPSLPLSLPLSPWKQTHVEWVSLSLLLWSATAPAAVCCCSLRGIKTQELCLFLFLLELVALGSAFSRSAKGAAALCLPLLIDGESFTTLRLSHVPAQVMGCTLCSSDTLVSSNLTATLNPTHWVMAFCW